MAVTCSIEEKAPGKGLEPSVAQQFQVLAEALYIYEGRYGKYGDLWRTYGWRGALFQARVGLRRAWHVLWNGSPTEGHSVDDMLDTINYLALAVRAVREQNRDGRDEWFPQEWVLTPSNDD